ncbi:acyltransferase domain-containing protein, partial [Amycolatopsis minnesotensis]|uniref:acyltransferase domain-containing protein n=1 Tax=Amycolatopsis minnesotensis TaxID=337894 RepID=UPI0031D80449
MREQASRLLSFVHGSDAGVGEVGAALVRARTLFSHRAVVLGRDREELVSGLGVVAGGGDAAGVVRGVAGPSRVAVVLPGQGAQRLGMGHELAESCPVFAAAFNEVCVLLDGLLGCSLREVMWGSDADALNRTGCAQPALFAVEVALLRQLLATGVVPEVLIGHSVGELAAAVVSGVLSLSDGCRLVAARARLMQALPTGGVMVSLTSPDGTPPEIELPAEGVWTAAINTPGSVVLAGTRDAVTHIVEQCDRYQVHWLRVSHAFHTPLMDPALEPFLEVARTLTYRSPSIPIISTVTGETLTGEQARSPEYWVHQIRGTVRFADAITTAHTRGITTFLEAGPGTSLSTAITTSHPDTTTIPT